MTRPSRSAHCAALIALASLLAPVPLTAGEVYLRVSDGQVTLLADAASLREIFQEWMRVTGAEIVNIDKLDAAPITLRLIDVPERTALATLLRDAGGYILGSRPASDGLPAELHLPGRIDRIIITAARPLSPVSGHAPAAALRAPDRLSDPLSAAGAGAPEPAEPLAETDVVPETLTRSDEPQHVGSGGFAGPQSFPDQPQPSGDVGPAPSRARPLAARAPRPPIPQGMLFDTGVPAHFRPGEVVGVDDAGNPIMGPTVPPEAPAATQGPRVPPNRHGITTGSPRPGTISPAPASPSQTQ